MFFQLSIRGAIASTVSGSSARRNSSACSENTTPKPQVAPAGILLEQIDPRLGVTLLPEIGEVETSGASADHGDTHELPPNWQYTVNWECRAFMSAAKSVRTSARPDLLPRSTLEARCIELRNASPVIKENPWRTIRNRWLAFYSEHVEQASKEIFSHVEKMIIGTLIVSARSACLERRPAIELFGYLRHGLVGRGVELFGVILLVLNFSTASTSWQGWGTGMWRTRS